MAIIYNIQGNSWVLNAVNCAIKKNRPHWAKWIIVGRV